MLPMTPLCELARKYETDKGGRHLVYGGQPSDTCHEYTPLYYHMFKGREDEVKRVLEIGINSGASLRMWKEFFPNAEIFGIDIRPEVLFAEHRIQTYACNAADFGHIHTVMEHIGRDGVMPTFDLIIDDGSHYFEDQKHSMQWLLPYVKRPNGIYVIEDLERDCEPELFDPYIPADYKWIALPAYGGIGKAEHCGCGRPCGHPEQLLCIQHV